MMKECIKCKQVLPLFAFAKDKSRVSGYSYKCKQCDNAKKYKKEYYTERYKLKHVEIKQTVKKHFSSIPPGVYMIKCLVNGKCYVGQSIKPYRRRVSHVSVHSNPNTKRTNFNLQADLVKYGREVFVFGIIEYCEPEQLFERETYWINKLNPQYNLK